MRYTFPATYDTAPCYLVPINGALIPLVAGALKQFEERRCWNSDEEYERAYNAFAALEAQMTVCTMQSFLNSNDRLYRLLDSALYGRTYTVETSDPLTIVPPIADVPVPLDPPAGVVGMLDQLPGVLDPGWFGWGGHKATIADIVRALRVGNSDTGDSIVSTLEGILGAGGNVAQIGELVTEAFTGAVSDIEEGGIFILLATSIVGNLAASGALSTQIANMMIQLSRIIHTLDGGTLLPPGDSILTALRGETDASATRNVIDSELSIADKLDTLISDLSNEHADNGDILAKLEEIRAKLV
jgi:hypothetical protein